MLGKVRPPSSLMFISNLFAVSFFLWISKAGCEVYTSLQWSPENPIFKTNATRCDDGETLHMNVMPSSTIYVMCPNPQTVLETVQSTKAKQNLFENLWIIYDKESFKTCNVNTSNSQLLKKKNRQLMQCEKPLELKFFPIVFQQFSAVSGGLEFTPGNEYYFLATSDGTEGSLNDTSGGHCNDTGNGVSMKFKVYVCNGTNDPKCADENAETFGKLKCNFRQTTNPPSTQAVTTEALTTESSVSSSTIVDTITHSSNTPRKEPQTGSDRTGDMYMILFLVILVLFVLLLMASVYHHCRHTCTKLGALRPQDPELGELKFNVNEAYRYSIHSTADFIDGRKTLEDACNPTNQEPQQTTANTKETKPLKNTVKQELPDRVSSKRADLNANGPNNNITNE